MFKRTTVQRDAGLFAETNRDEELPLKKRIKLLADYESKEKCQSSPSTSISCQVGSSAAGSEDKTTKADADSLLMMLPSVLLSFARSNGVSVHTVSDDEEGGSPATEKKILKKKSLAVPVSAPSSPVSLPPRSTSAQQQPMKRLALKAPRQLCGMARAKNVPKTVVAQRNFCLNGKPLSSRPKLPTAQHSHTKKLQEIDSTLL